MFKNIYIFAFFSRKKIFLIENSRFVLVFLDVYYQLLNPNKINFKDKIRQNGSYLKKKQTKLSSKIFSICKHILDRIMRAKKRTQQNKFGFYFIK